jgi:hypothetical protein
MSDTQKAEETGVPAVQPAKPGETPTAKPKEIGGPKGPEPTRFGDWEKNGRCIDF